MFIQKEIEITISDKGFYDITSIVNEAVSKHRIQKGLCSLFIRHTSASLTIQENADPRVLEDLTTFLDKIAPEGDNYAHDDEGLDDMPAHIKSMVTNTEISIPIKSTKLDLGTWQGIFLIGSVLIPNSVFFSIGLLGSWIISNGLFLSCIISSDLF